MKLFKFSALVVTGVVAMALTACGAEGSPDAASSNGKSESGSSEPTDADNDKSSDGSADSSSAEDLTVTLSKNGGFAGTMESLEVTPDAKWAYTKNRMAPKKGELSGKQHDKLVELVSDKSIAEVDNPKSDQECADIPTYDLSIDDGEGKPVKVKTDQCGGNPNKDFGKVVKLLTDATPI